MNRYTGVLLSVSSLPSKYGIGCFDKAAYDFVDWLEKSGQRYWQILPLGTTSHGGSDDSPYQAYSAFGGNPYFISLDALIDEGVLTEEECGNLNFGTVPTQVDYDQLFANRLKLLRKAYERSDISKDGEYQRFIRENFWWLDDYALFMALKNFFGEQPWTQWPEDIRMHWGFALDYYRRELYFEIEFQKYMQFKFTQQWTRLKNYANAKHIQIVGDIPIYVSPDSADVWAHPEMFQLDEKNRPTQVAGCPPDAFAADGQVWGNPLYRWDYHRSTGYNWWVTRMWYSLKLYDVVRIDHFRGFDEYFCIPAGEDSAKNGHWEKGPGMELFHRLRQQLGQCSVIAEDLGLLTDGVRQLVRDSGFPNMKVVQFAFDQGDIGGSNEYLPHHYARNCVVYTGTHDNETIAGWFTGLSEEMKQQVRDYVDDHSTPDEEMYLRFISLAMRSSAQTSIIPIQDVLGLGNDCRMNQPGTVGKNWRWRLAPGQVTDEAGQRLLAMSKRYARANWDALKALKKA
ncbi:MAG: 4-alpha-glucanotransferase [Oscillospiraceae bacterium]|nr:4-alpha-glucanotransferase [Oscillospiraceae bacterium]